MYANTYVITAYLYGLRDAHSYVVGAFQSFGDALEVAEQHRDYRGGKYGVEVVRCYGGDEAAGNAREQIVYFESHYFMDAGRSAAAHHPADHNKSILKKEPK